MKMMSNDIKSVLKVSEDQRKELARIRPETFLKMSHT